MGLAASQARFLGITMRKANCEFRSTELAQQKLQLTDQMSQISEEYSSAINSTKLTWVNEACDADYGVTYSLLMMPSAANDYNPYMLTTRAGAIILNSEYQAAAKAAGISMAGSIPSEEGYKDFIKALGIGGTDRNGGAITGQNLITGTTQELLLNQTWHSTAGIGAIPKDKSVMNQATLSDLVMNADIGGQVIDWLQVYREALGYDYDEMSTNGVYTGILAKYDEEITRKKNQYIKAENPHPTTPGKNNYGTVYVNEKAKNANDAISKDASDNILYTSKTINSETYKYIQVNSSASDYQIIQKFVDLEMRIDEETNATRKAQYRQELEYLKNGYSSDGSSYANLSGTSFTDEECTYAYPMYWEIYEKAKFQLAAGSSSDVLSWDESGTHPTEPNATSIEFGRLIYTGDVNRISGYDDTKTGMFYVPEVTGNNCKLVGNVFAQMNVFVNDIMQRNEGNIKSLTIGDLLSKDIVVVTQANYQTYRVNSGSRDGSSNDTAIKSLEIAGNGILDYVARIFGYGSVGTGLNTDETTDEALKYALEMTKRKYLSAGGAVASGSKASDSDPHSNSAYENAINYNRIGVMHSGDETYAALNLSNMVSAFLTFYDNALRGADSDYVVGKGNDGGSDGGAKTYFVTDDPNYIYITTTSGSMLNDEKINDFYSELYNNICQHGWRYDGNLDDYQYIESAIKNGKYSLMALCTDGYFYQARYNDIEYIVEEEDRDAIARAEADFTRKKAEITAKEDRIDIQTRKLDAEITELTTELNSVQNLISKSIEKTFALFSN